MVAGHGERVVAGGVGPGDTIPDNWTVIDTATGQPVKLRSLIEGKVALLAYFATF